MKLRSTCFSQIPGLILLGSIMSVPVTAIGNDFENEEDDQEQGYGMNDPYGNQTDLQKASQPVYNETEDDEENPEDWDYGEGDEEDDQSGDSEDDDDY